jgi:hypothetical protein
VPVALELSTVERRRRPRLLLAAVAGLVALAILAAVAVAAAHRRPVATDAAPLRWASPAADDSPVPTSCTAQRPAAPEGTPDGWAVSAKKVDPTGRYVVGSIHEPLGFESKAVLWTDGVPRVLPFSQVLDVNRFAAVLGGAEVYRDGEVTDLAGADDTTPIAISASGEILGIRSEPAPWNQTEAELIVSRPFVWRSPRSEPEALRLPDGVEYARPVGIDDDGTIVAAVEDRSVNPYSPVRTQARLLAWAPGAQEAREVVAPDQFAGWWQIVGGRGEWITAKVGPNTVAVWNYRRATAARVPSDTADEGGVPNASGWFGLWHDGTPQVGWVATGSICPSTTAPT